MKISVIAEIGVNYSAFLRVQLRRVAALVARGPRPYSSTKRSITGAAPVPLRQVCFLLVNDRRMSALHEGFMNMPGPTDVLTFPIDTDSRGEVTSGEVYVCVPEARRQSKIRRIDVKLELLLYALHGMLHLLGYDDRTPRAYRTMHRVEDQILIKLGLGPVFSLGAKGDRA